MWGSAISGILAYGFSFMAGLGGLSAWRWIFVMEALLTIVIAVFAWVTLVNLTQQAHKAKLFLTEKESGYILRRLNRDRGDVEFVDDFTWGNFLRPALDFKIWIFGLMFL